MSRFRKSPATGRTPAQEAKRYAKKGKDEVSPQHQYSVRYTNLGIKIGSPLGIAAIALLSVLVAPFPLWLGIRRPMAGGIIAFFMWICILGTVLGGGTGGLVGAIIDWCLDKRKRGS